jgi:hypothetical protein
MTKQDLIPGAILGGQDVSVVRWYTMTENRMNRIREYWRASEEGDWPAAGLCIGPGYVWIDHGIDVVARTVDELIEAQVDASAWSDTRIEIGSNYFSSDGEIVVQSVHSGIVSGSWRSMEGKGQRVTFQTCTIFKFDDDDRIVHEEAYYDMLSARRQLGYA